MPALSLRPLAGVVDALSHIDRPISKVGRLAAALLAQTDTKALLATKMQENKLF
jgi:hypothetical protein